MALMVLAHQVKAHNLMTAANFETRIALAKKETDRQESVATRIKAVGEPLVRYLFFSHEAPLTAPIHGTTSFATDFATRDPRDKRGRSLRDFDLSTRLFKYPCSYLVYSPAFDALPTEVKAYVSKRMEEDRHGYGSEPRLRPPRSGRPAGNSRNSQRDQAGFDRLVESGEFCCHEVRPFDFPAVGKRAEFDSVCL